ncbi:MAG TPA: hypothetical protein VGN73_07645 [Gemmatimonadaceae bacterium]|nr:hypothetical protein [Gemmatimonadaceae bacterium]
MSDSLNRGLPDPPPDAGRPRTTTHRSFVDTDGVEWNVWEIKPSSVQGTGSMLMLQPVVEPYLERGWLCFESNRGEKRRFAPVPSDWERYSFHQIIELWRRATPVRKL